MRTVSLLLALAVLVFVMGLVSFRPGPPHPPAVRTPRGPQEVSVTVAIKADAQEADEEAKVVPPAQNVEVKPAPNVEAKPALENEAADKGRSPARVVDISDGRVNAWRITGEYQTTLEDAMHKALSLAQTTVQSYLRSQDPPVYWVPSLRYVQDRLVKDRKTDVTDFGGSVGTMHRVTLTVKVTPEAWKDIAQQDRDHGRQIIQQEREEQAKDRMLWLGKILTALVLLLAAVAGYTRLDNLTLGNVVRYTPIAVLFVGVLAALMILLSAMAKW
jgi:hypothetical protein